METWTHAQSTVVRLKRRNYSIGWQQAFPQKHVGRRGIINNSVVDSPSCVSRQNPLAQFLLRGGFLDKEKVKRTMITRQQQRSNSLDPGFLHNMQCNNLAVSEKIQAFKPQWELIQRLR